MTSGTRKSSLGVSMIEVLVTIMVVALGMFGVAKFQGLAFLAGGYAKERAVATQLAQEKLDDLRSYIQLTSATGVFSYPDIANNAGGTLSSGNVTQANIQYSRTWAAENYYYCAAGSNPQTANCTPAKVLPDFKRITVTVAWLDIDAAKQGATLDMTASTYCSNHANYCVSLQSVIYPNDPAMAVRGLLSTIPRARPFVGYIPIGVPDSVPVTIQVGTDTKKESSKPVPEVSSKGISTNVNFDSITYSGTGPFQTDRRDEFTTVNCQCQFDGTGTGYTPARWTWDNGLRIKLGEQVASRPVATAPSINGDAQDPLCAKCCRDHHDVGDTAKPLYDPERPTTDYIGSDHKHYYYIDPSIPTAGLTAVTTGNYLEACRFIRYPEVPNPLLDFSKTAWLPLEANNEFYRSWWVFQDWRLVDLTVFPYSYLTTSSNLTAYTTYVTNTVGFDSGVTGVAAANKSSLSGRDITIDQGATAQLISRGVYVDKVYKKNVPRTIDDTYYNFLDGVSGTDWMQYVPFYEVNLTLLIDWTSNQTSRVSVTSDTINTITNPNAGYYTNYYSRGLVAGGASAGAATITSTARLSNSGITGGTTRASPSVGIDTHDNSNTLADSIQVIRSGASNLGISGNITLANLSVVFSTIHITPSPSSGVSCSLTSVNTTLGTYSCTVPSAWTGSLAFTSTATGYAFASTDPLWNSASLNFSSGVTAPYTAQNIIAYGPNSRVSGSVFESGQGDANKVSFSGTGLTCAKDSKTTYHCEANRGWTGTVNASTSQSGTVTITPNSRTYSTTSTPVYPNGVQADVTNENYTTTK